MLSLGGGRIAQVYAIRQAIARGLVAYYQKYVDEQSKQEIKVCSRQRPRLEGGPLHLSSQWDKVARFIYESKSDARLSQSF